MALADRRFDFSSAPSPAPQAALEQILCITFRRGNPRHDCPFEPLVARFEHQVALWQVLQLLSQGPPAIKRASHLFGVV